ncbi:hypothetical protein NDU88_003054 [Pleurodeles waltl]|uniref:Uncharacterized protein n=1 Tax=Pleurodeles waltl TaxID=8319 RepID=A0AAV7VED1_PLEWA|nr:hypothetical protein NDU88_003054 [Pleurodeles waltl]
MDKQVECLDTVEQQASEAEDEQITVLAAHKRMEKLLLVLQAKAEDLEACSRRNSLRIVDVAETTNIDNTELFIEQVISDLLGGETFSDMFFVEHPHRTLASQPIPGAAPRPTIARLLNCKDRDAALLRATELRHGEIEMSLYADFTQQVQEASKQFIPVKQKLWKLQLKYNMYTYDAIIIDGKATIFIDVKKLLQVLRHREPGGCPHQFLSSDFEEGGTQQHRIDVPILQETHLAPTSGMLKNRRMQGLWCGQFSPHTPGVPLSGLRGQAARAVDGSRWLIWTVLRDELAQATEEFFHINVVSLDRFATVWETFTVYIQGVTLSKYAGVLRSLCSRLVNSEVEISDLEKQRRETVEKNLLGSIKAKIDEYPETVQSEVNQLGKYAITQMYGEVECPGALAWLMLHRRYVDVILEELDEQWQPSHTTKTIFDLFSRYYTDLYTLQPNC